MALKTTSLSHATGLSAHVNLWDSFQRLPPPTKIHLGVDRCEL